MKKTLRVFGIVAVIAMIGLGFTGCSDPEPEPPAPVIEITTQPAATTPVTAGSISGSLTVVASVTEGVELSFQWFSNTTASNVGGTEIPNAVSTSFDIPANLTGGTHFFFVEVRANGAESVRSRVARVNVSLAALPSLTGTVSISGDAVVGETLTADTTGLGGSGTISFQWLRNGTVDIGTNSNTYIVQADDVGSTIAVRVTRAGNSGSITSASIGPVTPAGLPSLTGTVSISGIAIVGETLTANTASLGGSGDISFQWLRNGTVDIGTNSNTYIVQADDVGSTIAVRVTRAGNSGSITSASIGPVTPADLPSLTGTVNISGTAETGRTLTANTTGLGGSGTIFFQWLRDGTIIDGATSNTYVVQYTELNSAISVRVTRAGNSGYVTSEPTANVTSSPLTGTVRITGTTQVGETLTADTTLLGGSGTISFQWLRDWTLISGATSGTYVLQAVDHGSVIRVRVTRIGNTGSVTSTPSASVTWPPLTGTVNISGTLGVGETLTVNTDNLEGSGDISFQWLRNGLTIFNATSNTFTVRATDVGAAISVRVTRTNNISSVTSASVTWTTLTGTVSISGDAVVGETLTADTENLEGSGNISFQWLRNEATIFNATSNTYVLQAADVGATISVRVTRANNAGNVTSAPTENVIILSLTGTVSISGTVGVGETLTADISELEGSGTMSFQWLRNGTAISTGRTYVLRIADVGAAISVRVTRTNNDGYVTSNPTTVPLLAAMQMVRINAGSFQMGQADMPWASPVHQVTLTQGFYMGIHEVTQEQWHLVMTGNTNGISASPSWVTGDRLPVERVSWYDILVFANRLSIARGLTPAYRIDGSTDPDEWGAVPRSSNETWDAVEVVANSTGYRLPTEAQWEFAARAGTTTQWSFGDVANGEYMWTLENSNGRTHEVGTKRPNPWGLHDMHGNVWERVWDWRGNYTAETKTNPVGASSGSGRMVRGGCWGFTAEGARSAVRDSGSGLPFFRSSNAGFRLVRPVQE